MEFTTTRSPDCILFFFFVLYRVYKGSQGLLGSRVCLVLM